MTSGAVGIPCNDVESSATSLTVKSVVQQATEFNNDFSYRIVDLVLQCNIYDDPSFEKMISRIVESSSFSPEDELEKNMSHAVAHYGLSFIRGLRSHYVQLLEGTQASVMLLNVDAAQEVETGSVRGHNWAPIVGGALPASASCSPSSSSRTHSSASLCTHFTPFQAQPHLCAAINIRCAEKKCPFCSLRMGNYGFKDHLSECSEYRPDYGEREDSNVLQYISTVRAQIFCPGCNKWYRGHHQAQNANHAQSTCSCTEWDQPAAVQASLGAISTNRPGFNPSFNELEGPNVLATVDYGVQEALDNPFGSGTGRHPVGLIDSPGASQRNNDFSNEMDTASTQSFRDFDDTHHF